MPQTFCKSTGRNLFRPNTPVEIYALSPSQSMHLPRNHFKAAQLAPSLLENNKKLQVGWKSEIQSQIPADNRNDRFSL